MSVLRVFYVAALLTSSLAIGSAQTASLNTLVHFGGVSPATVEGSGPRGALTQGPDGQWYGTAEQGGSGSGYGVAYKMAEDGTYTLLAEFGGTTTGATPTGKLTLGDDGNFYGVTTGGGPDGSGTVFEMTPSGTLTTLYAFRELTKKDTGSVPKTALTLGANGYLYGTTTQGGANGYGTIFKILPGTPNTPIRVVDFSGPGGANRGYNPSALLLSKDGNFYGTTENGGIYSNGTVFRLSAAGLFTTITDFGLLVGTYKGPVSPRSALIQATNGLLYGTSAGGGTSGVGTVFSVTTKGTMTVVINFTGDGGSYPGSTPEAALFQATDGYLYGTTRLGGTTSSKRGTVFRMNTAGGFKSLVQFTGGTPYYGSEPKAPLVQDNDGHLFGTTFAGGLNGLGTVFSITNALPDKPFVITAGVDNPFGGTHATLTGTVAPLGTTALYYFEYGLTTSYGSRIPATDASAGSGMANVPVRVTATGLQPATVYHYRLRASNGGGITWGSDQTFTTGPNPNVVTPPADQLVGLGAPAQIGLTVIGVAPSIVWYKTGVSTSVGSGNSISFAAASMANAGAYFALITDGADSLKTTTGRLGVISTATTNVSVNQNQAVTLKLSYGGKGLGMGFQWYNSGGKVLDGGRISGAQTDSLTITGAAGSDTDTYYSEVSLGSLTMNSGNFNLTTILIPVMNMPSLGPWTVNGQAYGSVTAQNSPTRFRVTGAPAGVTMSSTGVFAGRPLAPGVYTMLFYPANQAGEQTSAYSYPLTVLASQVGEAGSFAGIVNRDPTGNSNQGGRISLTITTAGSGTGTLTHKGVVYSFTTAFNRDPGTTRSISFTPAAGTKNFPVITATLTAATGDIAGTVNGTTFTASRNPWTALVSVPAAQTGRFNIAFSPPSPVLGVAAYPQGSGYGGLIIDSLGNATWTGKLSDGTAISGSMLLSASGTVTFHHALYAAGTGSAQGVVTIASDGSVSSTAFDWLKNAQTAATRSYSSGFSLHNLDVLGGKYLKPTAGNQVIGLGGTTSNALLTLSQAGLTSSLTQALNFPATNVLTVATPNPDSVTFSSLDLNTGLFAGAFTVPNATPANVRTTTFNGLLLPTAGKGLGFFNLAQLPSPTTSALLSGALQLGPP